MTTPLTARERIATAALIAGWTSRSIAFNYVEYRNGARRVTVYYDSCERVRSASAGRYNLPACDTTAHVIGHLYGYQGARFEHANVRCTVTSIRRQRGVTSVYYRHDESGVAFVAPVANFAGIVDRHLGATP